MNEIYLGEIWTKSQCLQHEEQFNYRISNFIEQHGFEKTDHFRIWKRGKQKVIVCLVDDILSCSNDYHTDLPYLYDRDTVVITDNYINCPTIFQIINIPESFFGIYNYVPECQSWNPMKDFTFSVNRIDYRRFYLMLDLASRVELDSGYVNFNCEDRTQRRLLPGEVFVDYWNNSELSREKSLEIAYQKIAPLMPLKNYDTPFDSTSINSWVNIIIETYSSDNVISLSEKIFRALVTPMPWTVYSGRYTVAYLESLGFDCMSDIIDHSRYDKLKETEGKLQVFNLESFNIIKQLKLIGIDAVKQRCIQSAETNQQLLKNYYDRLYSDFDLWLSSITKLM